MSTPTIKKEALEALNRIQTFDPASLARESELGARLNFSEIINIAESIVNIYKRLPEGALDDFSNAQLNIVKAAAQADFNLFNQIQVFDPVTQNAPATRTQLISQINARRDVLFDQVWQFIAYGVARNTDTSVIQADARAAIQSISDRSENLTKDLAEAKKEANEALEAIRAVAMEQGVSLQATHFKTETDIQEKAAEKWLKLTYWFAGAFGLFAVLSLFLHKVPFLKPDTPSESIQLISSKLLIFTVLGYMLLLTARNYSSHKHNAVVNRHRQNALLTYRALVEAATSKGVEDIVLANAASCIFSPQETGFGGGNGEMSGTKSVLEVLAKSTKSD
jgi:hypothetical protein